MGGESFASVIRRTILRRVMKLINWVQFTWDLAGFPDSASELPEHYEITRADADDEKELRRVIASSFTLDPEWNATMQDVMQAIDGWLDKAFESKTHAALVLRHGVRIIGTSVLAFEPESDNHLSPGPCILMEYRNRGFGTKLLERSLHALREAGLSRASAVAKENSPVTKFLYTKFGSTSAPVDPAALVAA
jgi:GNAT superfamily N-acetyltransferase